MNTNTSRSTSTSTNSGMNTDLLSARSPGWRWPLAWLITLVIFLGIDAIWLSSLSAPLYQPALGHLMATSVDWRAVAVFYPLYAAGLVGFAVLPAVSSGQWRKAFFTGAFVGVLAYATYDLTNQATLRDWPWLLTLIDIAWGAVVSGLSSGLAAGLTLATCRRASRTSAR